VLSVACHPKLNMIASGSIDTDLTVRVWVDHSYDKPQSNETSSKTS